MVEKTVPLNFHTKQSLIHFWLFHSLLMFSRNLTKGVKAVESIPKIDNFGNQKGVMILYLPDPILSETTENWNSNIHKHDVHCYTSILTLEIA